MVKRASLPPGLLIQLGRAVWTGMWQTMMAQMAPRDPSGAYQRPESTLRGWVNPSEGPDPQRYRLVVGWGCPWAHRTLVVRALKGLEEAIPLVVVDPDPGAGGWRFASPWQGCRTLAELYRKSDRHYQGRSTVPVLWDTKTQTIINHESADIIVMLNRDFQGEARHPEVDLYPEALRPAVDQWNQQIYATVNNGVYRCGFAQTQAAYGEACRELFATLDRIDATLAHQRYLCGAQPTLADVRLFTTLIRFDSVYHGLFKCNRRRIRDYAHLDPYLRDLYQLPGVAATCNLAVVCRDYYGNLFPLNPGGLIPLGPDLNLEEPHGRDRAVWGPDAAKT